jgi:hypothetical protein
MCLVNAPRSRTCGGGLAGGALLVALRVDRAEHLDTVIVAVNVVHLECSGDRAVA